MARCDEGYLCDVCGLPVERLRDSELYLRYVAGWVAVESLTSEPDRHIACNPALAQFIEHPQFEPVACEGPFDKRTLDDDFVQSRTAQLTAAWERLLKLEQQRISIGDYPLQSPDREA